MPQKKHRCSLKSKQAKLIASEIFEKLGIDLEGLIGLKPTFEIIEMEFGKIYLLNGKPVLHRMGDRILPTLLFKELLDKLPTIVVDMGAVPFMCKGADVMAPGIVHINGEFKKGDLILIVDEKYSKALALCEALFDTEGTGRTKKGAVAKNLHFVSDKIWTFARTLAS